ncbi:hypothetical protein TCAL_07946 [Tigriopus californicus]|uniref:BRCT domain-containing protein n=1 Tax=Tigriopus californicus TaxID=6832 RepID=A0A553NFY7_TIGCA|nr:hypothetical protein TCAL_07946 [Tigriopus californicus]|eukprot:TCALIF_07946-PA protein Name:"Similar to XRCC1 DNA repair protein XRCC1 (Homo sapiens)" AED:0.09 eAED:0.09 QI:0/0/0/0.66/1/1/3/0/708
MDWERRERRSRVTSRVGPFGLFRIVGTSMTKNQEQSGLGLDFLSTKIYLQSCPNIKRSPTSKSKQSGMSLQITSNSSSQVSPEIDSVFSLIEEPPNCALECPVMPDVKISHVVSFSSEDPVYKADNLLLNDGKKKWRSKAQGEKQVSAILQLEKATTIDHIDLGNNGSAFIEVQVARSQDCPDEKGYKTLLVASSFMSPLESRNEQNQNRVRMFGKETLNQELIKEKWDRVKIVCSQPFNKHVKYGVSFVTLKTIAKPTNGEDVSLSVGNWFNQKKDETRRTSMAEEMKSEKTLASLALASSKAEKDGIKGAAIRPGFYQLKDQPKALTKTPTPDRGSVPKNLPRRDTLPGESPTRPASKEQKKRKNAEGRTPGASGRDTKKAKIEHTPPASTRTKVFSKLFEGVIFTISGYQNPLRGELRQKALDMGAKYRPDWSRDCSHLICAFANTPKFNQVKGKRGKIVKKDWLEQSHRDRKRYPWRRFCLDPKDKGSESEAEIWDEDLLPTSSKALVENSDPDTDEEVERIRSRRRSKTPILKSPGTDEEIESIKKEQVPDKTPNSSLVLTDPYDQDTDEEMPQNGHGSHPDDSDEAYNAETDVDEEREEPDSNETYPTLPDFWAGQGFFFYGPFAPEEKRLLNRKIVAAGGTTHPYMGPRVNFVVTKSKWSPDFSDALRDHPGLKFVRADFVHECWAAKSLINHDEFVVQRR